ncbi:MAG: LOG family protein [Simkaniaceae bacterium]|nr:LOG family protein [Simkaniaceae bacterium]
MDTKHRFFHCYDLTTPDGIVTSIEPATPHTAAVTIHIENIYSSFVGFDIDAQLVTFNLKSTLAQLGLHSVTKTIELSKRTRTANIEIELIALDEIGKLMLAEITVGAHIGRLFAADDRRRVREPVYLNRMFGRVDREGDSLLSLGSYPSHDDLVLKKIDGRTIAYLKLRKGTYNYKKTIKGLLPTVGMALKKNTFRLRELISVHQELNESAPRIVEEGKELLVKTKPLHVRTVFAKVVDELLPKGYTHTSANILEPTTKASGDIYEFYGQSKQEISDVPLEFYTLEPYKEHVFFEDRDQLLSSLDNAESLFEAFSTAPKPDHNKAAVFVVKGDQLLNLETDDWIAQESEQSEFPGIFQSDRQAALVDRYLERQPDYPFLQAIQQGHITSQGVLLSRYFPSPMMKRLFLSPLVQRCVKRIYFQYPSRASGEFFSQEDRATLLDLAKFGIPVYWVDERTKTILQYVPKDDRDAGLFVPPGRSIEFSKATAIGIYGSNLLELDLEDELETLFRGLLEMKDKVEHELLNKKTSLIMVTGGGPGAMLVGNKAAQKAGILSCANIIDFTTKDSPVVNEQKQNPYVEAKMTYRLERLVERQAEFNLNLPIILVGGIGTDFEFSLEEVRRKTGVTDPTPIILLGPLDHWKEKITSRFQRNLKDGTIKGSEWVSNCFYAVENAEQALQVYYDFFTGKLPIGPTGPVHDLGFATLEK